jgi:diguanylate cyclase (GGDEF)-like protein/PAS domain S-box-containing protein
LLPITKAETEQGDTVASGRPERTTTIAWTSLAGTSFAALAVLILLVTGKEAAAAFIGVVGLLLAGALAYGLLRLAGEQDRTEEQKDQALRGMQLLESRFDALLRHAADVVVVLTTNGTCVYISPSADTVLGIRPDVAVGRPLDVLLGNAAPKVLEQMKSISSLPGLFSSLNIDFVQPDGTTKVISARLANLVHDLAVGGVVLHLADITEKHKYEQILSRQAETDALTGLLNRARLDDVLRAQWSDHTRRARNFTLFFADLDGFKEVNDRCGHEAGDEVLREVAKRLRDAVRSHDVVVRYGGDEFVVVCPNTDRPEAEHVARRIHDAVCQPVIVANGVAVVGVSIGIAVGPQGFNDPESLMRHADETMYRIKQAKPSKSGRR